MCSLVCPKLLRHGSIHVCLTIGKMLAGRPENKGMPTNRVPSILNTIQHEIIRGKVDLINFQANWWPIERCRTPMTELWQRDQIFRTWYLPFVFWKFQPSDRGHVSTPDVLCCSHFHDINYWNVTFCSSSAHAQSIQILSLLDSSINLDSCSDNSCSAP